MLLVGIAPVHSPRVLAPPHLAPWIALDAVESGIGYKVGVSCCSGAIWSKCFQLQNHQQGGLQDSAGLCYASRLVQKFGWGTTNVVGDNTDALASARKVAATPRAVIQNKLLRRLFNMLWWSGTALHLFCTRSHLMPADALSRLPAVTPVAVTGVAGGAAD